MSSKNLTKLLELILVMGVLAFLYVPNLGKVEFHPDESLWIAGSGMFESYLRMEFKSPVWDVSYTTITQPPLPRYLMGISRYVGGYRRPDLNQPWNVKRGREFNMRAGAMPSEGLLWWSRLPMVILAILSIGLGFLLLRKASIIAAYAWLVLVLINPYFALHLRRAMGESPLVFFTMLTLYLATQALEAAKETGVNPKRKVSLLFLLAGITSGLAWASKLNGILVLGVNLTVIALLAYTANDQFKQKIKDAFRYGLMTSGSCAFTFLAIYPFLWPSPLKRTLMMFENRTQEMSQQTVSYSGSYMSINQRIEVIPTRVFHDYASLLMPAIFNFTLVALGALITFMSLRVLLTHQDFKPAYIIFLITAFFTATPIWLSQLDWDRYYIFPVLFATAFTAIAIDWIIRTGWYYGKSFWDKRFSPSR
jgi:hypothetical protein